MSDVARNSLTPAEVAEHTDALTRHFGEPVMPVSRYCAALRSWASCLREKFERVDRGEEPDDPALRKVTEMAWVVELAIRKSNLLSRLIYSGQPVRTAMCPVHKGIWSGYGDVAFGRDHMCECQEGSYDITGWLPAHDRPLIEKIALFAKEKGWQPAEWARHFPASPDYDAATPCTASAGPFRARGATLDQAAEALAEQLRAEGFQGREGELT